MAHTASQLARPLINEQANKHAQPPNIAPSGLTARFTNGPVTPPATDQHRPRKRGRRQAGRRRQWERGVARGLAEAPRRRALARCEGVAGGRERGTDVRRHGEQMSLCPKLIHSQADSFTNEFYPSRGSCGYALLLSSGNVPVTGALPDLGPWTMG